MKRVETNKYGNERKISLNVNLGNILLEVLKDAKNSKEVAERYGVTQEDIDRIDNLKFNIDRSTKDHLIVDSWCIEDVLSLAIENDEEITQHELENGDKEDFITIQPVYSITEERASEILVDAEKYKDSEEGINWVTLKSMILDQ